LKLKFPDTIKRLLEKEKQLGNLRVQIQQAENEESREEDSLRGVIDQLKIREAQLPERATKLNSEHSILNSEVNSIKQGIAIIKID
jgi:hypothetical protein